MSAGDIEVHQLSQEIDAVPRDPPLPDRFQELDAVDDSDAWDYPLTIFVDPGNLEAAWIRTHSGQVVDLKEER